MGERIDAPGPGAPPTAPGARVFGVAAACLMVAVLLNAFVLLRPGVAAVDHLAAGLVPAAVLASAAAMYPRLRPGARALVAGCLGATAVVRGTVAVVDAAATGPAPYDWPAMAAVPAGAVLLTVCGQQAWRSRRAGRWRWPRRAGWAVVAALGCYWFVLPVGVAIVATQTPRSEAVVPDLGRPAETVRLVTDDGLRLAAWYVPSRNGAAVIVFPGREGPVRQGRMLVRLGYGVMLVDPRGRGDSEGDPNALGWGGTRDIDAAVAHLRTRPDVAAGRIGGLGLSVGGELMIEAAASNPALAAVVSEGAGARSVRETVLLGARAWLSLPASAVQTAAVGVLSGQRVPVALDEAASRLGPRPLLLIYGERGQEQERELNPRYFAAARGPREIWEVPGAGHTDGIGARPAEYERRVAGFFAAALLNRIPEG